MIIDGSLVDMCSIGAAIVAPSVKPIRVAYHRWRGENVPQFKIDRNQIVIDVLNGASLVPFVLLVGCVLSTDLLKSALETSRVFMGIGGLIGIIFVTAELCHLS
jgi:hypothetical protein